MLRIAIQKENEDDLFLDVKDLSLSLSFEFGDIASIGKNKAPHSLSFTLPFSESNDMAFAGFRDLGSVDIDIRESLDCIVYEDTNEVLSGVINVMSMDLQSRTYKCVVYGKAADVYDKLREARWVDVFTNPDGTIFQGLDHEKTALNIFQNYQGTDITQGQLGWNKVYYPLQNTGLQRRNTSGDIENRALTQEALTNDLYQNNYYGKWTAKSHNVGIQVEYLLEKVFEYCGLTLVKNYVFDDQTPGRPTFGRMYYMTNTPNQKYRPYYGTDVNAGFILQKVNGAFQQVQTTTINGTETGYSEDFKLLLFPESGVNFDPDDLIDGQGFVAPVPGTYNFAVNIGYTRASGQADFFNLGVLPVGDSGVNLTNAVFESQIIGSGNVVGEVELIFQVTLSEGERMSLYLQWTQISYALTIAAADCRLRFLSYQGLSNTVVVPQSMGDESVGEWLEELMRRYNMTLSADANTRTATLQLRSELYDTDVTQALDWSDKLDRSKPVNLRSNTNDLKRKIVFQHALGENAADEYWNDRYARAWDRQVWTSQKQYANGEETIGEYFNQVKFMATPDSLEEDGFAYDNSVDQNDKPVMVQMFRNLRYESYWQVDAAGDNRFFVYRGTGVGFPDAPIKMYDNVESETNVTFITHNPALPSAYGNLLSWAPKTSYQSLFSTNDSKSLYQFYYEQEIREKYSIDTRILECEMFVNGSDLATSTWGDVIRIDLQYYYLESIRDYFVGGKKAAKVRLRRLLRSGQGGVVVGAGCGLGIVTYDIDCFGVVTPFDRYGNELVFDEACCAQVGGGAWFYDENTSICNTGEPCDGPIPQDPSSDFVSRNSSGDDFLFDPTQRSFAVKGGQGLAFTMTANTPKTGSTFAINSVGQTLLPLPLNANVGFNVDYIATNTSDLNRGDVEFGTWTGVVRSRDWVGSKAAADDQTSRLGDVTPLTVGVETVVDQGKLFARVFCGGMEGDWTLEIRATARIIEEPILTGTVVTTQDDSSMTFQDGFTVNAN